MGYEVSLFIALENVKLGKAVSLISLTSSRTDDVFSAQRGQAICIQLHSKSKAEQEPRAVPSPVYQ